jgi:hypothetical protein
MIDWFRSWHGAPTDPKWLGIARKAGVAPGIVVAVAWALMDRASQAEDRGSIEGYDADGLACFFGCEPEQVEAIVTAMAEKGMIADGRFTAWEKRQPKREDNAAERARAWRERKRTQANAEKRPDKDTDTEDSVANATAAVAAPTSPPPEETPEARLWRVGLTDLVALGVKEQQARRLIGSWRRDTGDDCQGVLAAIARAREYAVADPIPWITASLKRSKPNGKAQTVQSAAADLVDEVRKLNERPAGVRCGEGQSAFRLLPQG